MTTYNTGNPLGSVDVRDRYDNSENLDTLVNGPAAAYDDRLGVSRKSWRGMEDDFAAFLAASGFETPVLTYTDGVPLQVDRPTQLLERASAPGTLYSIKLPSAFPVVLSGTWAADELLLVVRSDQALRQELVNVPALAGLASVSIVGDGVTDVSGAIISANAIGRPIRFQGIAVVLSPVTITVPIVDTLEQIFAAGADVTISNGSHVRPEWFGSAAGNIKLAVDSLPSTGGVVRLANKRYPHSYSQDSVGAGAGIAYLAKTNVSVIGEKLPRWNTGGTALEGGTIIDGPFYVYADNFYIDKVGIDSGSNVSTTLWAGATPDAFNFSKFTPGDTIRLGLRIGSLIGMGPSVSALMHSILIENVEDLDFDSLTGYKSTHGVVIKAARVNGSRVYSVGNAADGFIIKANDYAEMREVNIGSVVCSSIDGSVDAGYGVFVLAETADGTNINIGEITAIRKSAGFVAYGSGIYRLNGVNIGTITSNFCTTGANLVGGLDSLHISSLITKENTNAIDCGALVTSRGVTIGSLIADGFFLGVNAGGNLNIENAVFRNMVNYCVQDAGGKLTLGHALYENSAARSNVTLTAVAGWTSALGIEYGKYGGLLSGSITAGVAQGAPIVAAGGVPAGLRPASTEYRTVPTSVGSATLIIGADGSLALGAAPADGTVIYFGGVNWLV